MAMDPNTVLTGAALAAAKDSLKKSILLADDAIYKTAGQLPTWFDRSRSLLEDALTFGVFNETRARVLESYNSAVSNWETFKKTAWEAANNGTVEGRPMTLKQATAIAQYIERLVKSVQSSIQTVSDYTRGTVLWKSVGQTFTDVVGGLGNIGVALGKLVSALAAIAGGAADTAAKTVNWLPWIVGALVLGPFVLKSFAAYKRGGAAAAAEAAAADLEAGRAAAGRGARAVWEGGKSLAKRAGSGGVLKGVPRRHRKRRRARA